MQKKLDQIRLETPGCQGKTHFNNAGSSLTPTPVQQVLLDYLLLEQMVGGYEAELQKQAELQGVYSSLARLVGASSSEIAVTQNATRAWDMLFYSIKLGPKDKILTCRAEYASNYLAFLQRSRQTGAEIVVLDNDSAGSVCLESLQRNLTDQVKVVAINHIPTNSGLIQPAVTIGALLEDHPAFYLLDACQSVGQVPLNVSDLHCDALAATSRKYLRGPRGVGFLYLAQKHHDLEPPFIDLHAACWDKDDSFRWRSDARRFETYELFVAGKLALGAAAEYAMSIGLQEGFDRLSTLAELARQGLRSIERVRVWDQGHQLGGIVSFTIVGLAPTLVREYLYNQDINVWTCSVRSARLDMESKGVDEIVRASFHYFNTEEEVSRFLDHIDQLCQMSS